MAAAAVPVRDTPAGWHAVIRTLCVATHFPASPTVIWARLTDFARWPEWFLGVRRLEVSPPPGGPDAEREITLVYGSTHRERITHWEPPKAFSLEVRDPPLFARSWRVAVRLEPSSESTRLTWEMRYEMRLGAVGSAIDLALVAPVLRLVLQASLRRLRSTTAPSPAAGSAFPAG
jgi:hypothetical protein